MHRKPIGADRPNGYAVGNMEPSSNTGGVAARIVAIATHVPERVLSNEELGDLYPEWPAAKILEKTGIRKRHIAGEQETAVDLAEVAVRNLFSRGVCSPDDIDFLILCTQAPDYILPTSACVLQHRLGMPQHIGALDINLGCSGFVYGLSLAAGLISAGSARRVLLVTADTYSKYIHAGDKSVRTLFGDGAAATLIEATDTLSDGTIGPFVYGTDGSGANSLIVPAGGFRVPRTAATAVDRQDHAGNTRSDDNLYMDGAAVMSFTLREVPRSFKRLQERCATAADSFDYVVLHQANKFMLDALQKKLGLTDDRVPRRFEAVGNTVSSTIPFVLAGLLDDGKLKAGVRVAVIGFGVGLSWAAGAMTF